MIQKLYVQVVSTNIHYAQVILDKGMKFYQQFFLLGSTLDSTPLSTFHLQKTQLEKKQSKLQAYQVKTCFPKSNARRFCMQEKGWPCYQPVLDSLCCCKYIGVS